MAFVERKMVDIEVAPTCNFDCPECLVAPRLKSPKGQYRPDLKDLLVQHLPQGIQANFIGLGEPTLPRYQRDIAYVLGKRPDLSGFIQSNGSTALNSELGALVESGRLDVGVSYDIHHANGSLRVVDPRKMQGGHVAGISMAVSEDTSVDALVTANLVNTFHNMRKILVEPLHSLANNEPQVTWEKVMNTAYDLQVNLDKRKADIIVFSTFYPHLVHGENQTYTKRGLENLSHIRDEWYRDKVTGIPALVKDIRDVSKRMPRVLTNSLVLDETTFALLGWEHLSERGRVYVNPESYRVIETPNGNTLSFDVLPIEEFFRE